MAKTPIAIPNIKVNGDDYWDSHKSQYNALIGGDVEPFKIDLSNWQVNRTIYYGWKIVGQIETPLFDVVDGSEVFYTLIPEIQENTPFYYQNGTLAGGFGEYGTFNGTLGEETGWLMYDDSNYPNGSPSEIIDNDKFTRDESLDFSNPPNNVTISITDPNNTYKYVDINGTEIVNYTINKDSMKNLMIRILPKSSS